VVVSTDAADATGDEVGVTRIFALHENAVAAEDGRGAVTLRDLFALEINLGEDAETAHDSGNGVPVHLDKVSLLALNFR
jgi:hypothetical protein